MSGKLKKIIKELFFYNFFYAILKKYFRKERVYYLSKIPVFNLKIENIKNCKIVLNRLEILKKISIEKPNAICAELGVAYGEFSDQILEITKPKLLVLIDLYPQGKRFVDEGSIEVLKKKYSKFIANKTIEILNLDSVVAASNFKNNFFDWIYIDTTHQYEHTIKELRAWKDKVKEGGLILGHDYIMGNWVDSIKYGVQEAVHQFCVEENWELVYLTASISENPTFGIKKI